jgi:hypothetical protein
VVATGWPAGVSQLKTGVAMDVLGKHVAQLLRESYDAAAAQSGGAGR